MNVKSFKKLKDNRYQVTIDDEVVTLYDDIIIKYNLLSHKEIDSKTVDKIKNDNNKATAYYIAIKYLAIKLRTEKEVSIYLTKKELDPKSIDYALKRLNDDGYFNNKVYLTSYINDQINLGNNGPYKIMKDLIRLGFKEEEINEHLIFDDPEWLERINKIIDKKIRINYKNSEFELKRKLMTDLIFLGYEKELISECLKDIHLDDSKAFDNKADKIYAKLLKKNDGNKLIYAFRSKMYQLGYNNELINNYLDNKKKND